MGLLLPDVSKRADCVPHIGRAQVAALDPQVRQRRDSRGYRPGFQVGDLTRLLVLQLARQIALRPAPAQVFLRRLDAALVLLIDLVDLRRYRLVDKVRVARRQSLVVVLSGLEARKRSCLELLAVAGFLVRQIRL